ncbi:conserved protein of unknown function [Tenacibaculum sp. 190524A02b]|uniref:HYC_CC_PP family protein n=1 Tax=Tenacibaculum vairaonense TaxID=3137860 RepID=UPI0032B1CE68
MKQVFQKITSFIMAIVVLFSTLSFTLDMHYCGDTLVDIAIFKKAETCGMEMQKSIANKNCSITKKNCCSDKQMAIEGQDELKSSPTLLSLEQQVFVASFVYSYLNLFESEEIDNAFYKDYSPPLVIRDIYKLDETYLI